MNKFSKFLCGGEISPETLRGAQRSTFVVIDDVSQQCSSFIIRIILASVIATGGIAADSTAVIVGSMLVAPLMSPMIGVALAAVMGRPRSTARALAITIFGMVLSIIVSMLIGLAIPVGIDTSSNTQIVSRAAPRLVDFVIALASSFMASIIILRDDIPDALAGVAISASIVPPLCVVGVALALGNTAAAKGSFLLFLTNFLAIQVAGMLTFAAMGLGTRVYSENSKKMRTIWYGTIGLCVLILMIPLTVTSNSMVNNAIHEKTIRTTATNWLEGTSYRLSSIDVDSGHVTIEVIGSGTKPSMKLLGARLQEQGIEVDDIRMAVVHEEWYRPSVHPDIAQKTPEELELSSKGATSLEQLEKEEKEIAEQEAKKASEEENNKADEQQEDSQNTSDIS